MSPGNPDRRRKLGEDTLSILIVDNHFVVRHGIKQLVAEEFRGVIFGEAQTKSEALEALEARRWHAVILEIGIPGNRGLQLLQDIIQRQPDIRALLLTVHPEWHYARKALNLGALVYLTKDSPRADLMKAIRQVLTSRRQAARSPDSAPSVIHATANPHETLSSQEFKVLLALGAGKGPGEIAADLNLSIKTVSTYKRRILNKMQLNNGADLIRYTIDHQIF